MKTYTISIFTEDRVGLLNRITILFTRRHINISSITASQSEVKGVYRYTIVANLEKKQVEKLIGQIEKQVEVIKAFYHEDTAIINRELALYKIHVDALTKGDTLSALLNQYHARIINVSSEFLAIEQSGSSQEIQSLFHDLEAYEILEFARSGQVAITKPMRTLSSYLTHITR